MRETQAPANDCTSCAVALRQRQRAGFACIRRALPCPRRQCRGHVIAARASSQLTINGARLSGNLSASAWNGAVLSGLKPVDDTDTTLWINADGLKKDTATATASVKQTAANAVLTWQSFDLDKGETLVFDQQDHADWTVLNRIVAGG